MTNVVLYFTESCPYCLRVLSYLKQAGISIPTKNIAADPANRQELIRIGGKSQVPCLTVDGKAVYESNDIIQWFKINWKK